MFKKLKKEKKRFTILPFHIRDSLVNSTLFKGQSFFALQTILTPALLDIADSKENKIESSLLFGDTVEAFFATGIEQKGW